MMVQSQYTIRTGRYETRGENGKTASTSDLPSNSIEYILITETQRKGRLLNMNARLMRGTLL